MKSLLSLSLIFIFSLHANAQQETLWMNAKNHTESSDWISIETSTVALNKKALDTFLRNVSTGRDADILIPYPKGELVNFTVWPSELLAPEFRKRTRKYKHIKGSMIRAS